MVDTSSNRTAKPSRMALSKRGESESASTSSRRIRWSESVSGTDSGGIRSGLARLEASAMTISTPRSIAIIFEAFARLPEVALHLIYKHPKIHRNAVVDFYRK